MTSTSRGQHCTVLYTQILKCIFHSQQVLYKLPNVLYCDSTHCRKLPYVCLSTQSYPLITPFTLILLRLFLTTLGVWHRSYLVFHGKYLHECNRLVSATPI